MGVGRAGRAARRLEETGIMTLRIGDTAPDFTQLSTEGEIHFHEWKGEKWAILVLASQELHARLHDRARRGRPAQGEFDKRGTKVLGLSVDQLENTTSGRTTSPRPKAPP